MYLALRQTYRHLVQQAIVRQEMRSSMLRHTPAPGLAWQGSGIAALFSAAAFCGTLAQVHLG